MLNFWKKSRNSGKTRKHADALRRKAYNTGVRIAIGTDFSLINETTGKPTVFDEMYLLVDEVGLSPIDVITAATITNAELLGIEEKTGSVEAGKRANLVVLKENPVDNIRNIEKQLLILKNGQIVIDKR